VEKIVCAAVATEYDEEESSQENSNDENEPPYHPNLKRVTLSSSDVPSPAA